MGIDARLLAGVVPEPVARAVQRALWERGADGDLAAIEAIGRSHPARPAFAELPSGLRPRCHPDEADVAAAVALVKDQYWNGPFAADVLAEAVRASAAWVGIEADGRLVATARATSDRAKRAWVYDVAVADAARGKGIGTLLMRLLLDHPAVRRTSVFLTTRDAMPFYERLGFTPWWTDERPPYPRTHMVLAR